MKMKSEIRERVPAVSTVVAAVACTAHSTTPGETIPNFPELCRRGVRIYHKQVCDHAQEGQADGNFLAGRSLRSEDALEKPGLHHNRGADFGVGHWGQYLAVFRRERSVAESAALSSAGQVDIGIYQDCHFSAEFRHLSEFP